MYYLHGLAITPILFASCKIFMCMNNMRLQCLYCMNARLYVWEFACRHPKLWSYTNRALPIDTGKSSLVINLCDNDPDDNRRPAKKVEPGTTSYSAQEEAMQSIATYMRTMNGSVNQALSQKKQELEVAALEAANSSQNLKDLCMILNTPGVDDATKLWANQQISALMKARINPVTSKTSTQDVADTVVDDDAAKARAHALRFM